MRARYVTINQERWRLVFASRKAISAAERARGSTCTHPKDGLCDFTGKTIYVYNRLRGDALVETLTHEYLHAVRGDCTEEWVTVTAAELTQFLLQNTPEPLQFVRATTHEECGDAQEGPKAHKQRNRRK